MVETTDAKAFAAAQATAIANRSDTKLQVAPVTEADAQAILDDGGKLFMTSDGKSGAYVKKDGYMGGLFKDPKAGRSKAAQVLQEARVKAGGKFFDAFGINTETGEGTTLEQIYIDNGFRPVVRMTFNEEYADEGWEKTNLKKRPDNVFFVYDPNYKAKEGEGERIEDYDAAYDKAVEITKSIEGNTDGNVDGNVDSSTDSNHVQISAENSSNYANLTEDGDDFVFFHKGKKGYKKIKRGSGESKVTSREEASALGKVGGMAMYYPNMDTSERQGADDATYAVRVPKDKVYDFNSDPLNLIEEARALHEKEHPNKAFDANSQVAYVTKVAAARGYDMVVAEWAGGTRAQTVKELTPSDTRVLDGNIVAKDFEGNYESNKKKGFKSVIPKTKEQALKEAYDKIYNERDDAGRYDKVYHLRGDRGDYTQDEITKIVEESDLSEETKQAYRDALNFKEEGRRSEKEGGTDSKVKKPEIKKPKVKTPKVRDTKSKLKDKVLTQIENAKKALSKIAPNVTVKVYNTQAEYMKATGDNARGEWNPNTNTISINLEKATDTTVAHEVMHAVLGIRIRSDKRLQEISDNFVEILGKNVDGDVAAELNEFTSRYAEGVKSEEAVVELTAMIANNYAKLSNKAQGIIKQWLDKIAKMLGLKDVVDNDVIDLLNTLARKISTGEVIDEKDLNTLGVAGTVSGKAMPKKSLANTVELKRFPINPNTKVRRGVPLKKLVGKEVSLIESDRMTGAYIEDLKGNPIFKFLGGIHFPVITGKWWASSNESKANQLMNACSRKRNSDGYIYTAPVLSKSGSHMSNKDMFEAVWQFMKHDLRAKGSKVTKGKLIKLVDKALSLKTFKDKGIGEGLNLRSYDSIDTIIGKLDKLMYNSDLMTFDQRKAFIGSLLGRPVKQEARNFPTAGSLHEFASKFEEEDTKVADGGTGNIVMVMRTKGELRVRKTPKSDEFYHNSYPYEIYSTGEVEVIFLDGSYNITEAFPVLERKDGSKFTWEGYEKKHGKVSKIYAESQFSRTASQLVMATGKVAEVEPRNVKKQLTPQEALKQSQDEAKKSRDQALDKNKTIGQKLRGLMDGLLDELVDRQGSVKKALNKVGLDKVVDYMVTKSGHSAHAKNRARAAYSKIFDGLSDKMIETLEEIILNKRVIAVDKNRRDRGLEPVKHQGNFNQETSELALEGYREALGDKVFEDLSKRADAYFDEYKGILLDMRKEGLISQETYEMFAEVEYQPRIFLDFLEDMDGNLLSEEVDKSERVPLSGKQLKAMKGGHEGSQLMDAWYLLQKSIQSRSAAIFSNRLNKTFALEYEKTKKEVEELKKKTVLTTKEKNKVRNFRNVQDNVKEDEIIGYTKTGNKYKLDGHNTKGLKPLYYYIDGVQHRIFLKEEFHQKLTDTQNAYLSSGVKENVALISGTSTVKTLATGNNPLFFITNTPRDLAFVLAFSNEYNSNVIGNSVRLIVDSVKGVNDVVNNSANYQKFLEYGGGMDYLAIQGKYKDRGWSKSMIDGIMDKRTQDKIVRNRVKRFLDKFNLASEMGIRLAVFNKSVANQTKGKDISSLSKEELDLIYTKAVRSARELTDFNQGGKVTKALDAALPYLNAATQGTRAAVNNLKDRPVETMFRIAQITGFAAASTLGAALGAIALFRSDDDDDKDKTNADIYFQTLEGVSEYDLTNYFVMPLGYKDEKGNWKYLRVAKAQALSPMLNTAEFYTRKALARSVGVDYRQDLSKTMKRTIDNNILPINLNPLEAATRVPLVDATFAWNGIDSYTGNPLSWDRGNIPSSLEGIVDKRVEPLYHEMGETLGLSHIRLQSVVESFITTPSTNPYIGVVYGIGNLTSSNKTVDSVTEDFGKDMVKAATNRLLKSTSEYNEISKLKGRVSEETLQAYKKHIIVEDGVRTLVQDYKGNRDKAAIKEGVKKLAGDNPELIPRIISWIESEAKKKKLEPIVASLKYERNKEVRALLIAEKFGDMLLKENRKNLSDMDKKVLAKLVNEKVIDEETLLHYSRLVKQD